jgi:Tfp pilus assembly protein PilF
VKVTGADRPRSGEAAQSWNDFGTILISQGQYDSAETALERALEIRRRHGVCG